MLPTALGSRPTPELGSLAPEPLVRGKPAFGSTKRHVGPGIAAAERKSSTPRLPAGRFAHKAERHFLEIHPHDRVDPGLSRVRKLARIAGPRRFVWRIRVG